MWSDSFAEVDLRVLFPDAADADLDRVRRTAAEVDRAQPAASGTGWGHCPENARPSAFPDHHTLPLLYTSVALTTTRDDWMELGLLIGHQDARSLIVTASIEVCCACPQDHNMHEVRENRWLVGTSEALADAFEAAARTVVGWVGIPADPAYWRTRAGLPSSPVR